VGLLPWKTPTMCLVCFSCALRTPPNVWVLRTLSWRTASAHVNGPSSSFPPRPRLRPAGLDVATILNPPAKPKLPPFFASIDFANAVPHMMPLFRSYASVVSMGMSTSYMPVSGFTRSSVMRGMRIWDGSCAILSTYWRTTRLRF